MPIVVVVVVFTPPDIDILLFSKPEASTVISVFLKIDSASCSNEPPFEISTALVPTVVSVVVFTPPDIDTLLLPKSAAESSILVF